MGDSLINGQGSEERFKLLSAATFEGICIHSEEMVVVDANQQFADMYGYTLNEVKGMDCFNLIAPQLRETTRKYLSSVFQGPHEVVGLRKDGSTFPVEARTREFRMDGETLRMVVLRDMTNHKEMERQIADSEKRYRELYNNSPIALYQTRISDGKLLECNPALVELFGYDNKEEFQATSNAVSRYVNIDDRTALLEKLKKDKQVKGFQIQVTRKGGESIWIELTAEIFPEQGYFEGAMQDITASKLLTETERKVLRLVVEGKSNKEIAYASKRSTRTIEDHRSHIMQKLHADNLVELIQKAKTLRD